MVLSYPFSQKNHGMVSMRAHGRRVRQGRNRPTQRLEGSLEHQPRAKLNSARLIEVEASRRNAEIPQRAGRVIWVDVVEIDACRAETPAIEQIEELGANLEIRRLVDARLLQYAQVFAIERLRAQV